MGVIYKLKPEIVEFVIQQKKNNRSLSCRSLTRIVQDEFQQKVSKSSINKVLKAVELSSPVGRRGVGKRTRSKELRRKFSLPEKKRKELFSEKAPHQILSDLKITVQSEALVDGVGSILLKAAEWKLSRQPILQDLLKEHCAACSEQEIQDVAALLSSLKVFHIGSLEDFSRYGGQGLWDLGGVDKIILEGEVFDALNSLTARKEFFLKFSLRVPQIFTQVLGFRYILKGGVSFFIDGQQASVWTNVQSGFPISLTKATEILAKTINNVHSKCLCAIAPKNTGKQQENKQISDFFKAFNNVHSRKIQQIELIGENAEVLGSFDEIPQIKRFFIASAWPWEDMFQKFLEARKISSEGKLEHGVAGRDITYKETIIKWDFDGAVFPVRGIQLFETFVNVPFAVLVTNLDFDKASAGDVAFQYFQRWPNMERGTYFSTLSNPSSWKTRLSSTKNDHWNSFLSESFYGRDPLWGAIDQLTVLLDRFGRQQFFPEIYEDVSFETMNHRFYSLPGRIVRDGEKLIVDIQPPKAASYLRDFLFAAQRLNESNVRTFDGKVVVINII